MMRRALGPWIRVPLWASCALLLAGCPSDTVPTHGSDGDSETGGTPPVDPIDPFGGEGSEPPGEPDQNATWSPPTSLGNGLVYDTRFDIAAQSKTYSLDVTGMDLAAGVEWSSFVTPHRLKIEGGFRPTAIDGDISIAAEPDGRITLEVVDRSAYASDDDANYIFVDTTAEQSLARSDAAAPGAVQVIY